MKATFLISALILLVSCTEFRPVEAVDIYFQQPQPFNDAEIKRIPKKFHGRFVGEDSLMLIVTEKIIYSEQIFVASVHQSELDSVTNGFETINGQLIEKATGRVWFTRKLGDSIQYSSKDRDTIFSFSESQKAKRINGKLILNFKKDSLWVAKILSLDKNTLQLNEFARPEDLQLFDSIVKSKSTKIEEQVFILHPTRKEFSQILKSRDIGYKQEFQKVNKDPIVRISKN